MTITVIHPCLEIYGMIRFNQITRSFRALWARAKRRPPYLASDISDLDHLPARLRRDIGLIDVDPTRHCPGGPCWP